MQTALNFFNTTNERNPTLRVYKEKTENQNQLVLSFFKAHPFESFTADEVFDAVATVGTPVTSFRRSITCLKDSGDLEMTGDMRLGKYGRLTKVWKLK